MDLASSEMGVVVSALAAAGPAVLEDLETPYAVLQERRKREKIQKEQRREKTAAQPINTVKSIC